MQQKCSYPGCCQEPDRRDDLIDILMLISIVSKRLAKRMAKLAHSGTHTGKGAKNHVAGQSCPAGQ